MKRFIAAVSFAIFAAPAAAAGLPYEQNVIDRMLPNIEKPAASSGETRDAAPDATRESPWANDWNFIAPAK